LVWSKTETAVGKKTGCAVIFWSASASLMLWFLAPNLVVDSSALNASGEMVPRGEKSAGGKMDYAFLVFERGYGAPELGWFKGLHDKA
jgi:hypothetical protein